MRQIADLTTPLRSPACSIAHSHDDRQAMIDEFDLDQDGEINEQEFVQIMMDEN